MMQTSGLDKATARWIVPESCPSTSSQRLVRAANSTKEVRPAKLAGLDLQSCAICAQSWVSSEVPVSTQGRDSWFWRWSMTWANRWGAQRLLSHLAPGMTSTNLCGAGRPARVSNLSTLCAAWGSMGKEKSRWSEGMPRVSRVRM